MKLVVIGAGAGGYAAAVAAAREGVAVTLVEQHKLGGTCLHHGCIPTKTLRASADVLTMATRFQEFGLTGGLEPTADMPSVLARKSKVIAILEKGLEKTAAALKVRLLHGKARIIDPAQVRVTAPEGTEDLFADGIILATGSSPLVLPALRPDHEHVLSSDDILNLRHIPEHLVIVGGGVIGCELAFIYRAFGSRVTVVEGQKRLLPLPSVDEDVSSLLLREMKKKKITVELGCTVSGVAVQNQGMEVRLGSFPALVQTKLSVPRTLHASALCVTVGRVPNHDRAELEAVGIHTDTHGWIKVNDTLETSVPGIFAIGDALGPGHVMLAHMATAEAQTAVHNFLHPEDRRKQQYAVVPSAIFTDPEIGVVGLTEEQARARGGHVRTALMQMRELGKSQAMGMLAGFVKLVVDADTDRLLGVHIVGAHASDLIAEATLALQKGCTSRDLAFTIHAHPTLAEGLYEAAQY